MRRRWLLIPGNREHAPRYYWLASTALRAATAESLAYGGSVYSVYDVRKGEKVAIYRGGRLR